MALGFTYGEGGGQDRLPILKYDSKARIWHMRDRRQVAEGRWENFDTEIAPPDMPSFLADLAEVEVGWIRFTPTPDFRIIPISQLQAGAPFPTRPPQAANKQEQYRQGFRVLILMPDHLGGDLRHFSHTASCVIKAFDAFHDLYTAEAPQHPGQVPIVRITGYDPIKSDQGTSYAPKFQLNGWAERPLEFDHHAPDHQPEELAVIPSGQQQMDAAFGGTRQPNSAAGPPPHSDTDAPAPKATFRATGR